MNLLQEEIDKTIEPIKDKLLKTFPNFFELDRITQALLLIALLESLNNEKDGDA